MRVVGLVSAIVVAVIAGVILIYFERILTYFDTKIDYDKLVHISVEWWYDPPIRWQLDSPFESPNGLRMEHHYSIQYTGEKPEILIIDRISCGNSDRYMLGRPENISWGELQYDTSNLGDHKLLPNNLLVKNGKVYGQNILLESGKQYLIEITYYLEIFDRSGRPINYLHHLSFKENDSERGKYLESIIPYKDGFNIACSLSFRVSEQSMSKSFEKFQMYVGAYIWVPSFRNDGEEIKRKMENPFLKAPRTAE